MAKKTSRKKTSFTRVKRTAVTAQKVLPTKNRVIRSELIKSVKEEVASKLSSRKSLKAAM